MSIDTTMAEVIAGVATFEAARTGLIQFVEHTGAAWHVHAQGVDPMPGASSLAVVLPGEDRMGVAKRILGARLSGLCVPQAVLALVGAEKRPEPKPDRPTKREIAASVSQPAPTPAEAVRERQAPVVHEVKPPATVQGSLF